MANSYLNKTMGAGNRQTWTWSAWIKRSKLGVQQNVWGVYVHNNDNMRLFFTSADVLEFKFYNGTSYKVETSRVFRDTNAWYHIVCVADTTNSTEADRLQLWVNGERQSGGGTQPTQNLSMSVNDSNAFEIGRYNSGGYFDGYMSHVAFVDGTALTPTSFGQTDSTSGIWKFKNPTGVTWGTNGFHLKMENSGNLGLDSSGQTNNYTVNGNLKQAVDTPSNVYATLSPLIPSTNIAFSNGNNRVTGSQADNYSHSIPSTLAANTGKWYWEVKYTSANSNTNPCVGAVKTENYEYNQNITSGTGGYVNMRFDGYSFINNNSADLGLSGVPQAGDIIMAAMDLDNGKMWLGTNGTFYTTGGGAGNPATGAYPTFTTSDLTDGTWTPVIRYLGATFDCNFGNGYFGTTAISSAGSNGNGSLFEYDVPSGYYALNTKNINTYG